jgi:hypothetical protein
MTDIDSLNETSEPNPYGEPNTYYQRHKDNINRLRRERRRKVKEDKQRAAHNYQEEHREAHTILNNAYMATHAQEIQEMTLRYREAQTAQTEANAARHRERRHSNIVCKQCGETIVRYTQAIHRRLRCLGTLHLKDTPLTEG